METKIDFNALSGTAKKYASKLNSVQAQAIDELLNSLDAGASISDGLRAKILASVAKTAIIDANTALAKIPQLSQNAASYVAIFKDYDLGWRYFVESQAAVTIPKIKLTALSSEQDIMRAARNEAYKALIPKFSPEFLYNSTARLALSRISGLADALNAYRAQNNLPPVSNGAFSHIAQSLKAQIKQETSAVPTIEHSFEPMLPAESEPQAEPEPQIEQKNQSTQLELPLDYSDTAAE